MSKAVCPWWLGYFLLNPLRKLRQDPRKLLGRYIREGMRVMDIGCGMGFFTLPMAGLAGEKGGVLAVDLQEEMIAALKRRAAAACLAGRVEARVCSSRSLGIDDFDGKIDFALAFAVIHEVPEPDRLLAEVFRALKIGGRLLVSEPCFHVSASDFENTVALARGCGFAVVDYPPVSLSRSVLLEKSGDARRQ